MSRYEDNNSEQNEMPVLSRTQKNQDIYDELYLNNKVVDFDNVVVDNEEKLDEETIVEEQEECLYEEKNYSINEYIKKAHEKQIDDKAMRDLDNQEFKDQEDEISKLIASIDEKETEEDFFKDLRGDNEDTMIKGTMKTDEFDNNIYETLKEENDEIILDKALSENTVLNLKDEEESKIDHTFERIFEDEHRVIRQNKNLPVIIFSITLFMLIAVIIIIVLFH